MKYTIDNYIGQEVKRTTFLLKRPNGESHFLYCIVERLENDAAEALFGLRKSKTFRDEKADGDKDKIFVESEFITLEEAFAKEPWNYTRVDGTSIINDGKGYGWNKNGESVVVPSNRDERSELMMVIPRRKCSAFVKYCKPQEASSAVKAVLSDDNLKRQLKYLSERVLGYDLNIHHGLLGSYMMVCYNPIYKDIDFTEDAKNAGIFVRVNYRAEHVPLKLVIKGMGRDGEVIGIEECETGGALLKRFNFKARYPLMEIIVLDEDSIVVDYYKNLAFIHSIQMGMSVKSKEVALTDEAGNVVRIVEKFSKERPLVIGEKISPRSVWDSSQEYEYEKLEKSLDFVFFDGEKDKAEENHKRAQECVERIINQTATVCYICDSYFDVNTLYQFVAPIQVPTVEVRVISSKERLGADDKEQLKKKADEMREKGIANVHCKMLRGEKSALHDRFIVADDKVWMLGCSLNEFGKRATTLIRVPSHYCKKLIDWAESYWNDADLTEAL